MGAELLRGSGGGGDGLGAEGTLSAVGAASCLLDFGVRGRPHLASLMAALIVPF